MTIEQINKSIETGRLELAGSSKRTHFEPVFLLIFIAPIMPLIFLFDWLNDGVLDSPASVPQALLLLTVIPAIVAYFLYRKQVRDLDLRPVKTDLSPDEIRSAVVELAKEKDWEVRNNRKTFMLLKTHPPFSSGSWGEQITILFDKDVVWVNSICDPEKRASIVSAGRNRQNLIFLISKLRFLSRQEFKNAN